MNPTTILVVSGIPRCGSSLVMRMLRAGGVPLYCDHEESFETDKMMHLPHRCDWLRSCVGRAVKLLDIQRYTPPRGYDYRVIWLDRNPEQQALSQLKMLRTLTRFKVPTRPTKAMIDSITIDTKTSLRLWNDLGAQDLTRLSFEDLINKPHTAAMQIGRIADTPHVDVMAGCVIKRTANCLPYMLEASGIHG